MSKTYQSGGFLGRGARVTHAVNDVTLTLPKGGTLGIVGESGSGKSTLARCIVRLIDPDTGAIRLNGTDLATLSREEMRRETRHIQMVFQDPFGSLNPRRKAGELVAQGLVVHGTPRARGTGAGARSCSRWSASIPHRRIAIRTSSPADSASASGLHARSRSSPKCSSPTSRSRHSMSRCRRRC